jgi:hypothetical protein
MSLFSILATEDPAVVGAFLKERYIDNPAETARRAHAQMLDEFFQGKGDKEMERVIDILWKDKKNSDRRKAVLQAGLDKYDNILARVAQEKATVYNEPTQRRVSNDTNERYQAFLELLPQDAIMGALDAALAIHEDALLWYRVRVKPTGEREPLLEVISPARFWAVSHPSDRTLLVAVIIDQRAPMSKSEDPTYRVWTDDETFMMTGKCEIIGGSRAVATRQMPGILCSTAAPGSRATLLAECPATDCSRRKRPCDSKISTSRRSRSARTTRHTSQATRRLRRWGSRPTPTARSSWARALASRPSLAAFDTEQFIDNANHIADAAFANHGVPPTVRSQKDASSGAEIELRMLPIRKLREKRIPIFRRIEKRIAAIMAMVNGMFVVADSEGEPLLVEGDFSEFAFNVDGWSIDFGEVQQIMTEAEKDATYETRKRLQLTDPVRGDEAQSRHEDGRSAELVIKERIRRNTWFVTEQKDLMAASGSLGARSRRRRSR